MAGGIPVSSCRRCLSVVTVSVSANVKAMVWPFRRHSGKPPAAGACTCNVTGPCAHRKNQQTKIQREQKTSAVISSKHAWCVPCARQGIRLRATDCLRHASFCWAVRPFRQTAASVVATAVARRQAEPVPEASADRPVGYRSACRSPFGRVSLQQNQLLVVFTICNSPRLLVFPGWLLRIIGGCRIGIIIIGTPPEPCCCCCCCIRCGGCCCCEWPW